MLFLGNAEMTDVFKCKKPGTKCCSPKTLIREVGHKDEPQNILKTTTLSPISTLHTTMPWKEDNVTVTASKIIRIFLKIYMSIN